MTRPIPPVSSSTLQALKALLGTGGSLDAAPERAPFETDFRGIHHGSTPLVAMPDSTAVVSEFVRFCAREGLGIVPQGGNTSYCGGATPRDGRNEIVLSLRRMRKIRAVDALNDSMTAEAGCVLADLQSAAAAANRLLPMSLGSEGSCTLGGIEVDQSRMLGRCRRLQAQAAGEPSGNRASGTRGGRNTARRP